MTSADVHAFEEARAQSRRLRIARSLVAAASMALIAAAVAMVYWAVSARSEAILAAALIPVGILLLLVGLWAIHIVRQTRAIEWLNGFMSRN